MIRVVFLCLALTATAAQMPPPFTRQLYLTNPPMTGNDVIILQNLLARSPAVSKPFTPIFATYDATTATAVKAFEAAVNISVDGITGPEVANHALAKLSCDHWSPSGLGTPQEMGYKYAVHIPVYRNRSNQAEGKLLAPNGTVIHTFTARLHGHDRYGPNGWPHYSNTQGLNEFTSDGNTPTGLAELDLNTPESDHKAFGPYDIHRIVRGLDGNLKFMINITSNSPIRNGILMHTGEWPGWHAPEVMPNSDGCIHIHPKDLKYMDNLLTTQYGVVAHKNLGGVLPYPYKTQGMIAIWEVGCKLNPQDQ